MTTITPVIRKVVIALRTSSWQRSAWRSLLFPIACLGVATLLFLALLDEGNKNAPVPLQFYSADQVPQHLHAAFILTGYRTNLSAAQCLSSIFHLHNETFNIWTHLLPAIAFWALCWRYYWKNAGDTIKNHRDDEIISLFCASKAAVFTASFVAHTFSPTTEYGFHLLWRLDWSMICVAIYGTFTTLVYFTFYQNDKSRQFWMRAFACSAAFMFLSVNTPVFTLLPPGLKLICTLIPVPCSVSFLWQVFRTLPKEDVGRLFVDIKGPTLLAIAGLFLYGTQLPERWFPGWFDLVGNSHAMHHIWTTTYAVWMFRVALGWSEWRSCELKSPTFSAKRSSALKALRLQFRGYNIHDDREIS